MGLRTTIREQCLALQAALPATGMTLFSSVSLLQVTRWDSSQPRAAGPGQEFDGLKDEAHPRDGV